LLGAATRPYPVADRHPNSLAWPLIDDKFYHSSKKRDDF
jgi:hypothetical protein